MHTRTSAIRSTLHIILALVFLFSTLPPASARQLDPATKPDPQAVQTSSAYVPDRLIVRLDPLVADAFTTTAGGSLDQAFANLGSGLQVSETQSLFGAVPQDEALLSNIYLLELAPGSDVLQATAAFSANAAIEWAEPDYLAFPATIPNDPQYPAQWGLAQIGAPAAWDLSTGSSSVAIAMLDSGLDFAHPDLASRIWTNPGEIAGNGLDDDNNGYIDDLHGWDFVNSDNSPADDNGHGTQTAGVAGAASNNGIGVAGVCWDCALLPVKVMQAGGVANYSDIAAGVLYAARKGARVINISLGGYSESSALLAAIQAASETYGAVIVAGAGNDALDTPFYPAAYPQVLAVAATAPGDLLWSGSNYGEWVDISAPGENITTTFQGGDYGAVDGTSLSTAFVSGLAGLLRSQYPDWTAGMVRAQIIHTAESIDSLNPGFEDQLGAGRIAAGVALSVSPHPLLSFAGQTVDGNPNGRPEPGSSVALVVSLYNDWATAANVQATLSSASPYVTVMSASATYGEIPAYATVANPAPFGFTVNASAPYGAEITFNLRVTASGGYVVNIPVTVQTASAVVYPPTIITTQTWTNDRYYIINRESGIPLGNTLTIEPGTAVHFEGDYSLTVQGSLIADGTPDQPIQISGIGSGKIVFADTSTDAVFDPEGNYLSGSILRYSHIDAVDGVVLNLSAPFISNNQWDEDSQISGNGSTGLVISNNQMVSGGISVDVWAGEYSILANTIIGGSTGIHAFGPGHISGNNISNVSGLGISTQGAINISDNRVVKCSNGIFIDSGDANGNLVATNTSIGLHLNGGSPTLSGNTIVFNGEAGVQIDNGAPIIHHNNLIRSESGYALRLSITSDIDATQNWWGSTILGDIADSIYDKNDDYSLGIVDMSTYLTAPEPDAPAFVTDVEISPDTTLGIQTATFDVKFSREMDQTIDPHIIFTSNKQDTWTTYSTSTSGFPGNFITAMASGPDGSMWVGTAGFGAASFDGQNWTPYTSSNSGLPGDYVFGAYIATDGAAWLGDMNGVSRFDGSQWTQYTHTPQGYFLSTVRAIDQAADGSLWFGTQGAGAIHFDGTNWSVFNAENSGMNFNSITALKVASDSSIWFGSFFGGVIHYDGSNWIPHLPGAQITGITETPDGAIWMGSLNTGVYRFADGNWTNYRFSRMSEVGATAIASSQEGFVWVVLPGFIIVRFDGTEWQTIERPEALGGNKINIIAFDSTNSAWFGSESSGALVRWNYPVYSPDSGTWIDQKTYRATLDVNSLIHRENYLVNIREATGTDGIEIAPVTGYPFTVDYAGAISDTTPPPAPSVELCAGGTPGSLSANWSVRDPETAINLYSYAIGTSPGGSDVVDWTTTTTPSFSRSNLNLTPGRSYYIAVKARNAGGLWSAAGIPPGVMAGSGVCTTNILSIYLPAIRARP